MGAASGIAILVTLAEAAVHDVCWSYAITMLAAVVCICRLLNLCGIAHCNHHGVRLQWHDHQGQAQQNRADVSQVVHSVINSKLSSW